MAAAKPRTRVILDTHPSVEFVVEYGWTKWPDGKAVLATVGGLEQSAPQDLWDIAREENRLKNAAHTALLELVPAEMTRETGEAFDAEGQPLMQVLGIWVREDGQPVVGEVRKARGFLGVHEPRFTFGELDRKISVTVPFLPEEARAGVADQLLARFADAVALD